MNESFEIGYWNDGCRNPGCFDDPSKTFADLYVKSGHHLVLIAKRLCELPMTEALGLPTFR